MTVSLFGFSVRYSCEIWPIGRPLPAIELHTFGTPTWRGRWLEVVFQPNAGHDWAGRFDGVSDSYPLTGVFATPNPWKAIVVNTGQGYYVDVREPTKVEAVRSLPVLGVRRVLGADVIVVHDFQRLTAYDSKGVAWAVDELVSDDLAIQEATSDGILCQGFDAVNDRLVSVTVDPADGVVVKRDPADG